MKLALSITMGLGLLLSGCLGSEDIIARTAVGKVGHDPDRDLPDGAPDSECAPEASRVLTITKSGRLYALQPETAEVEDLGIPSCLKYSAFNLAIDHNGAIWVQANEGNMQVIDPVTFKCTERKLKLEVGAMAFVYDPTTQTERLYAIEIGELSVIDPKMLKQTHIGTLKQTQPFSLSGTRDGQLYGAYGGTIGRVDLENAHVETVWSSVDLGSGGGYFVGGVVWGNDFILGMSSAYEPNHFLRFSTETERTAPVATFDLHDTDGGSLMIASSTCASAPQN